MCLQILRKKKSAENLFFSMLTLHTENMHARYVYTKIWHAEKMQEEPGLHPISRLFGLALNERIAKIAQL